MEAVYEIPYALMIINCVVYIYGPGMGLGVNSDYSLNSVNQLIFVMVKYGVLFEVRTESLNII
jgi:hypothetical protein